MSDKEKIRSAYRLAIKANNFKPDLLMKLHKAPLWQVENWTYKKDKYPTFMQAMELYYLIRRLHLVMPIELTRLVNRVQSRVKSVADDMQEGDNKTFETVGTRRQVSHHKRREKWFKYHGDDVTVSMLAQKFGVSEGPIRNRIEAAELNYDRADITCIDFSIKPKKRYHYILNGETVTIKELAKETNVSHQVIRLRIAEAGIKNGGDVSSLDFRSKKRTDKITSYRLREYSRAYRAKRLNGDDSLMEEWKAKYQEPVL